ncbi:MAG TPA: hypothetical protein VH107_05895 [Lacipirellulaceae bacterium]|jgi:hypothetical protein|nr:hypothetical protein [Lacipirellulaceae bacterium]
MVPTIVDRVPQHTSVTANERIRRQTERSITRLRHAGPTAIQRRLDELDAEWDIERVLEANAASAVLIGAGLGASVNRRWFALPAVVAAFLLQHAVQGWCPPLPVFRRLGFRTATEIDRERYALKAVRGDFEKISDVNRGGSVRIAESVLRAAEA